MHDKAVMVEAQASAEIPLAQANLVLRVSRRLNIPTMI